MQRLQRRDANGSCIPNFERMFAATWRVHTTATVGTAFHVGDGRFVTAHHVIDGAPPVVTLTFDDRTVAAAGLGPDPERDVAVPGLIDDDAGTALPALRVRSLDDVRVGNRVYLVGYPASGPVTAATGTISRVWADELPTSSWSFGGNRGGPLLDGCGDVLGALLHESNEEYGIFRLHELAHTTGCPERVNFELEVRLESPEMSMRRKTMLHKSRWRICVPGSCLYETKLQKRAHSRTGGSDASRSVVTIQRSTDSWPAS